MTPRARDLSLAVALASLTQLLCARCIGGRLHPDEVHQYLEVAHRAVWAYGTRPHEWYSGMRNVAAPGALAALLSLARALRIDDPRAYLALVHALVGALSWVALACVYDIVALRTGDRARARTATLALAVWVPWQNLAFRTLGETFSTLALLVALRAWERSSRSHVAVGLWVGAAFVLRYPAGVFALPFVAAYCVTRDLRGLARWSFGVALALLALGALDYVTWGRPWHSLIAYADYNLVRDRARIDYGAQPAWYYLAVVPALAPVALLAAGFASPTARRASMALTLALTYLAVMSLLAHKEPRFALAAVPLLVVAAALSAPALSTARVRALAAATLAHSAAALCVYVWSGVCEGDATRAAMWAARRRDVGALALVGVAHPGYAVLHRDVPVYGDARGDVARSIATIEGAAPVAPGRRVYAVCQQTRWGRSTRCVEALGARWGDAVYADGEARVFDVTGPRR